MQYYITRIVILCMQRFKAKLDALKSVSRFIAVEIYRIYWFIIHKGISRLMK